MVGKNTLELIIAARDRTGGAFKSVKTRMKGLEGVSGKVTAAMKGAAKAGALIGGAAVVAGIAGSTKAFMDFEDAMANVRKTTGFTKEQISVLSGAINDLALRIPVAQTELANIAAVAGQLGITGQKNILDFTETAAKMSTAFDMSAESVAIAAAKLANIYDIPISQVSNLGSAINVLGNTTAASESQIMAFSMALGPAGQQLGFAATEVISLGASMISMGMDASNAGTRLNRAFTMIGKNLEELSSFMGVTTEEFTESFESMPMETFLDVIDKLSEVEGNLKANTIAANLFGEIGAKGIKSIAGNIDGLRTNLINTEREFIANTSLTEEFAAKTDTLKARFTLLKNSVTSLLIDIGGELAPTLNQVIEGVRNIIPPLKDLIFEIGGGFREMFESITRQAGSALDPLIAKVEEAGEKMSKGLNFKTLLDDVGVFIGAALNPLIRGFTWLIDKLGPLWELIGKGAAMFHDLANALKTEEGRLDDILDATQEVTKAKQDLFDINERLRGNVETLADALEKAGGWTTTLVDLEADAKTKTDALAVARLKASEAITVHGASSEIAKTAILNVKIAEEAATEATNNFNTAVGTAAGAIIDEGVATEGLEKAQLEFVASTETATIKQGELKTAVADLETELEEAKGAPCNLGESFTNFGKLVASIFLGLPLKIAKSILKVVDVVSEGLGKIGLGSFTEKFDSATDIIKEKIEDIQESLETSIEDPLSEDIPKASEAMEEAVTSAANAIVTPAGRVKEGVDEIIKALGDTEEVAEDTGEAGEKAFEKVEITVDKTTGKIEVLTDDLGETANVFEENERAAQTLLELDWGVFSKLEGELPKINSGISDMAGAFTGLEVVLENNIDNLASVKASVASISDIAAPFMEEGFGESLKAISGFAGALSDAGSAINSFSDLQNVSTDGCANFSLSVHDMVSALKSLKNQMGDLAPTFGEFNSLVNDLTEAFVYSDEKIPKFTSSFSEFIEEQVSDLADLGIGYTETTAPMEKFFKLMGEKGRAQLPEALRLGEMTDSLKYATQDFSDMGEIYQKMISAGSFSWLAWSSEENDVRLYRKEVDNAADAVKAWEYATTMQSVEEAESALITSEGVFQIKEHTTAVSRNILQNQKWIRSNHGVIVSTEEMYAVMQKPPEEQQAWFEETLRTGPAIEHQWNKQTRAIESQGEKLKKLTESMQPLLEFMRSMNAIASLSTLSYDQLNIGLTAITDTLTNLGTVLETFDLQSAMQSLFASGDVGEIGGSARVFMDTMEQYESDFNTLITYSSRLTSAILNLVASFDALANIGDSVLADPTKIKEVFKDITDVMTNFSTEMSGAEGIEGVAQKFADGMDAMITSADPLIIYFQENNAAVDNFNTTLGTFKATISNVVDTMDLLKDMSKMILPSVDELEAGFDKAREAVLRFDEALSKHMGVRWIEEGGFKVIDEKAFSDNFITNIKVFGEHWTQIEKAVSDNIDTFVTAATTINNLLSIMMSLSKTISDFNKIGGIDVDKLEVDLGKVALAARDMETYLGTDAWKGVTADMGAFGKKWEEVNGNIEETIKSFTAFTSVISSIVSSSGSLISAIIDIGDISIITSDKMEEAFATIPKMMAEMTEYMAGDSFKAVTDNLSVLNTRYLLHKEILDKTMPSFESATKMFSTLAQQVISVSDAFLTLKDSTIISSRDMEKAIDNIKSFTVRFTEALRLNLGSLVTILTDLDTEWKIHSKVMEEVMPSFKSATSDVGSLIGTITSLSSALKAMSEMGTISSGEFGKGFGSIIVSISNFTISLRKNVGPLIGSLQELRKVWVENEEVLVPLMADFQIITRNLRSVADNMNAMKDSFREVNKGWVLLERGFDRLVGFIKTTVLAIKEFYTPEAAAEVSTFIKDIGKVIDSFKELNSKIEGVLNDIKTKIRNAVESIETKLQSLENLNGSMFYSGQNLIASFINGINSMQEALEVALENVANTIKAYLGVASPTELGALKNVDEWPRNLVKSFSEGINAEMGGLNVSLAGMVAPAAVVSSGSVGGSKTNHVTIHINQKINDKATADYAVQQLTRAIQKHAPI